MLAFLVSGGRQPAQGEIDAAVAIDVMRLNAYVIPRRRSADDVLFARARVRVPDDRVFGHGHHVGLVVTVDVGDRHRIANLAEFPRFLQEIDPWAAEICYAVTVADVNGDQKPDVVAVTEDAVVWYANPTCASGHHPQKPPQVITCASSHMTSTATAASISRRGWLAATRYQEPQHSSVARPRQARPLAGPSHSFDEPTLHRFAGAT